MSTSLDNGAVQIGRWVFSPSLNRLQCDDELVELEPIASRLLEVFASAPGEVFTADELVTRVWGDRIVSDNPVYKAIANLRKALGETRDGPRYIETIRKRGYRLVAPVSPADEPAEVAPGTPRRKTVLPWVAVLLTGAVALYFAIAELGRESIDGGGTARDERPIMVVLPFETQPGTGTVDFVGAGLARSVASGLTQSQLVDVIGATSTDTMFNQLSDPYDVAQSLGARFVVFGVATLADDRLSLRVELDDVQRDDHRWSATFEQSASADSYIQWEVASELAAQIANWVGTDTNAALATPEQTSFAAYESFLRGRYVAAQGGAAQLLEAERLLLEALSLDPNLVPAMNALASVEYMLAFNGLRDPATAQEIVTPWMQKALMLKPDSAEVHVALGRAKQTLGAYGEAEQAFRTALNLDPNHSGALQNLAWLLFGAGRIQEATPVFERALRVEPAAPMLMVSAGMNAERNGQYRCAEHLYRRGIALKPEFPNAHFGLGQFSWAVKGDLDQAEYHLDRAISLDERGPIYFATRGLVALDRGDADAAARFAAEAQERAPDTYWPRRVRMLLAAYLEDHALATELAERQIAFTAEAVSFRLLRDAALRDGDTAKAVAVYPTQLLRVDAIAPGDIDVVVLADLAYALAADGQDALARSLANRVLDIADVTPQHDRYLAEVVAAEILGDRALAIDRLSAALSDGWQVLQWWYWERDPALADIRATVGPSLIERTANTDAAGDSPDASACAEIYRHELPPLMLISQKR